MEMEKNIINALHRLERLGQENSRMTEKARDAAKEICQKICSIMPEDTYLPEGYMVSQRTRNIDSWILFKEKPYAEKSSEQFFTPDEKGYSCGMSPQTGDIHDIIEFAEDLANGLLGKFAEFLEKRKNKMEAAEKTIREATEEI